MIFWGAWAVVIDGNDQAWSSNFAGRVDHASLRRPHRDLSARDEDGDPIAPPNGYVGAACSRWTDIAIDPAGNVWVADNWQQSQSCFAPYVSEATSTLCGGNGLTVFYSMAKPVNAPQIGPAGGFE